MLALSRDLVEDWAYEEGALAATETVAAFRGHPRDDLPPEIAEALREPRSVPEPMRLAAIRVCDHLLSDRSNMHDCWAETPELDRWLESVRDLRRRLDATD